MSNKLTNLQRVLNYLPTDKNKAVSTIDLTLNCYVADPRRAIAYLRKYGHNILDYWKKTESGKKYKVYYLGD